MNYSQINNEPLNRYQYIITKPLYPFWSYPNYYLHNRIHTLDELYSGPSMLLKREGMKPLKTTIYIEVLF